MEIPYFCNNFGHRGFIQRHSTLEPKITLLKGLFIALHIINVSNVPAEPTKIPPVSITLLPYKNPPQAAATAPQQQLTHSNAASYKFNMSEFRPEDISITVTDTTLKIHALREENEGGHGKTYRK